MNPPVEDKQQHSLKLNETSLIENQGELFLESINNLLLEKQRYS